MRYLPHFLRYSLSVVLAVGLGFPGWTTSEVALAYEPALKSLSPILDQSPVQTQPASLPITPAATDYQPETSAYRSSNSEPKLMKQAMQAYNSGNMDTAEGLFKQVIKLDPQNNDAWYNLGAIAEGRNDLTHALSNYQAALRLAPDDPDCKQAIAQVQDKIKSAGAQATLTRTLKEQASQQQQQDDELHKLGSEAAAAYRSKNYDLAVKDLNLVAQQQASDPDVQFALAQAYRGNGNYPAARYHMLRAIALVPDNQNYRQVLSQINQEAAHNTNSYQGDVGSGQPYDRTAPAFSPYQASGSVATNPGDYYGSAENSANAGQITPFTADADSPPARQYGYTSGGYGLTRFIPFMGGGYYGGYSGSNVTPAYRVTRAVTRGLAGAALGAMMGGMLGGGRSGMGRGALYGGMAGLIFGAF